MKGFRSIKVIILVACLLTGVGRLYSAGEGWAWGGNWYGQLGDNTTGTNRWMPVQTHLLSNLISIDGGCDYSLAAKLDGTVWAWGRNNYGQLGVNSNTNYDEPIQTWNLTNVIKIATGYYHALALKSDRTVWAWGSNSYGQVGDNATGINRLVPVQTHIVSNIIKIDGGCWHSIALRSDFTVWIWGRNNEGEVGDNTTTSRSEPESTHITPDVIAIAAGTTTSLALKSNGTLWAWGSNNFGQLGIGSSGVNQLLPCSVHITPDVIAFDGGDGHTVALKSNGTVWSWGRNNDGQLGIGFAGGNVLVPDSTHITDVIAIVSGAQHSIAIKSDGTIWAWGRNQNGQIGDNTNFNRPTPVQVRGGEQGGQYLTGIDLMNGGGWHSVAVEDAPLAVEQTCFDAIPFSSSIRLRWSEACAAETFQYIIIRSLNEDNDYTERVRISNSGSSPAPKNYSYTDKNVNTGLTYYYKLCVVKTNGSTRWYGPVSAMVTGIKGYLSISPNPFRDRVNIEYCTGQSAEGIELKIYDMCGRLVKDFSLGTGHSSPNTAVSWDTKKLPQGIYYIKLKTGDSLFTEKAIILK